MKALLAVFIGGGIGSIVRYGLSLWLGKHSSGFPTGTFIANIISCIVLGIAYVYFTRHFHLPQTYKLFILVGFCGGFSTFSTFSLESFQLMEAGQWGLAILYIFSSLSVCLLVLYASMKWGG